MLGSTRHRSEVKPPYGMRGVPSTIHAPYSGCHAHASPKPSRRPSICSFADSCASTSGARRLRRTVFAEALVARMWYSISSPQRSSSPVESSIPRRIEMNCSTPCVRTYRNHGALSPSVKMSLSASCSSPAPPRSRQSAPPRVRRPTLGGGAKRAHAAAHCSARSAAASVDVGDISGGGECPEVTRRGGTFLAWFSLSVVLVQLYHPEPEYAQTQLQAMVTIYTYRNSPVTNGKLMLAFRSFFQGGGGLAQGRPKAPPAGCPRGHVVPAQLRAGR